MAAGSDRGSVQVVSGVDVHLLNPKVRFLSFHEHLGLDGEAVIGRFDRFQRSRREYTEAALGVRQEAILRRGCGGVVKRTLADSTIQWHPGGLPPSHA